MKRAIVAHPVDMCAAGRWPAEWVPQLTTMGVRNRMRGTIDIDVPAGSRGITQ